MAQPFTFQFGNWVPDLQNVTAGVTQGSTAPVPISDCLNVYYQDGAYRCIPGLNPNGPAFPVPVQNAFTWYDNTSGQEIVFAGTAQGLYSLIDQAIAQVNFPIVITVPAVGFNLRMRILGTNSISPVGMTFTLGAAVVHGGLSFSGILLAQSDGTSGPTSCTGYMQSSFGSLTPAAWGNNTITALEICGAGSIGHHTTIFNLIVGAPLSQNFFTSITVTAAALNVTFQAAAASLYQQTGNTTTWGWSGPGFSFTAGNTYSISIIQ